MERTIRSPVTPATAALVRQLREQLAAEFGCDFAFIIMGRGHYVARHTIDGILEPVIAAAAKTPVEDA